MPNDGLDTGLVQAGTYSVGDTRVVKITTSEDYTSVTFGEYTLFFDREDGQYDGWGMDLEQDNTLADIARAES